MLEVICLRTTIQFQEIKRFVHLPKSISALASCTTSVYVNLSKNSFFCCLSGGVPDLRVQRYGFFLNYQNFSKEIFDFRVFFMHLLISVNRENAYTLLYII